VVPHGLRSTFRDWASERTNYPREVTEMALAHRIDDKVEAAYRRGDLFIQNWRRRTLPSSGSSAREMRYSNFLSARSSPCPQGSKLFPQTAQRKCTCVHWL
jgi:integrase